MSNAFHPLQTFQLGSCTKSVQINLVHHQMCATSHERTKGQNASFSVQLSRGQFILTFLSEVAAFEWLVTKVANGGTKVLAEHFHIIKCVSLFTFYRFQAIKCARRQPSTLPKMLNKMCPIFSFLQ